MLTSGLTSTTGFVFPRPLAPAAPRTGILGRDGPAVAGLAGLPAPGPPGRTAPAGGLPAPVPGAGLFVVEVDAFGGIVMGLGADERACVSFNSTFRLGFTTHSVSCQPSGIRFRKMKVEVHIMPKPRANATWSTTHPSHCPEMPGTLLPDCFIRHRFTSLSHTVALLYTDTPHLDQQPAASISQGGVHLKTSSYATLPLPLELCSTLVPKHRHPVRSLAST